MEKLICTCCGGKIDRDTLTCEYCGTQYKKDNRDNYIRIETYRQPVQEFRTEYMITDEVLKSLPPKEASEIAMRHLALEIAQVITPYCQYSVAHDIRENITRIRANIKIIEPSNVGLDFDRLRG